MSDIKISIIMPVYKVEEYVGKAIESILAQTFTDFEFLIVDDGTPDRSGEICDAYAKKDHRIRVIHKENGGAPSARNTAIDIAQGKYVYFLDSDDWAEPQMLADMYELAEKHQAQLVVCRKGMPVELQSFVRKNLCGRQGVYRCKRFSGRGIPVF